MNKSGDGAYQSVLGENGRAQDSNDLPVLENLQFSIFQNKQVQSPAKLKLNRESSVRTHFHCTTPVGQYDTLWEKEKMLVTSISSFSHNVFYSIKDKFRHSSQI